jgi:hypothetical protein
LYSFHPRLRLTSVDVLAISNFDHEHNKFLILHVAYKAKITNAIFPERPERAFERLAEQSRIGRGRKALPKKPEQSALILWIQPPKLLFRVFV